MVHGTASRTWSFNPLITASSIQSTTRELPDGTVENKMFQSANDRVLNSERTVIGLGQAEAYEFQSANYRVLDSNLIKELATIPKEVTEFQSANDRVLDFYYDYLDVPNPMEVFLSATGRVLDSNVDKTLGQGPKGDWFQSPNDRVLDSDPEPCPQGT